MTKPKYTQQELEQLYAIALRDGWDRMSPTIAPKGLHRLEFHITETTKGDDQQ